MSDTTVGKDVQGYCTSCRMDLMHIIVSLVGDRISKVECKTCRKTHQYRTPKGIDAPAPKRKAKTTSAKKAAIAVTEEWERMSKEGSSLPKLTYSPKSSFKLGDRIQHPTYGEGFVTGSIFPNKIEILFYSDIKLMIHHPEEKNP